ncbi:MAG: phosphatidylglycerophosphatase A [Chitinivibrionales bacterium]
MKSLITKWFKRFFGSLFFLGYFPAAPGTVGSIAVVAAIWFTRDFSFQFFDPQYYMHYWLISLALTVLSILVAQNAPEVFGDHDPKQFVLDEVAGQFITFFMVPISWRTLIMGLLLFRFFDIVKPFPVHNLEEVEGGVGMTMDDIAAGVMANISLLFLLWLYHGIQAAL